jgi:nicotinate-nucleotide adenylyltransferase
MKIGLFFGSFNPIHTGHLIIAGYMAEFTDLDRVWFVISPHNPLKEKNTLLPGHHRLQMVQRAIEDYRKLKATDIEFKLPQPSYTITTLQHLKEKYPTRQFALIMGADNLTNFHKWKNHEQILSEHELYIYARAGVQNDLYKGHPQVKKIDAPLVELSASFIRQAIKNKKDVRYMMPEQSYKYLKEMHFYEK